MVVRKFACAASHSVQKSGCARSFGTVTCTRQRHQLPQAEAGPRLAISPYRGAWSQGSRALFCSASRRWFSTTGGGKEEESDDDFKPQRKAVSTNPDEVSDLIRKQIESNNVMLYMKGTPSEPQCGFSAQVVRILHTQGVSFSSVNVLDYPPIREGIKSFSEWPTIPQVFVKGEFVGGCDIMSQMHESGELETMLKKAELV